MLFKAEDKLHGCQVLHTNPSLAKLLVCEWNEQSVKQKERVGHRKWQQLAVVKCIVGYLAVPSPYLINGVEQLP